MNSNLLVESFRGDLVEKAFYGWVLLVDKNHNVLKSLKYQDYSCYLRSCEKPFQALVSLESNVIDKFNLDKPDIALAFGSHTGSIEHVSRLRVLLNKLNLTEDNLLCGTHIPVDIDERNRIIIENSKPNVLHNNCSGKHIFILAACLANNWNISNYNTLKHPVQGRIKDILMQLCSPDKLYTAFDGCGLPVHGMSLIEMAAGFAKLFAGNNSQAELLADAVSEYPIIAGGKGRLDSLLIQLTKGKIIAKVGADGLIILTIRHSGEALLVKIFDGNNDIRNLVTIEALKQLKWIDSSEKYRQLFDSFYHVDILNLNNQVVGHNKFRFNI